MQNIPIEFFNDWNICLLNYFFLFYYKVLNYKLLRCVFLNERINHYLYILCVIKKR